MRSLLPWIKNAYKALVPVVAGALIALATALSSGTFGRTSLLAIASGVATGIVTYLVRNVPLPLAPLPPATVVQPSTMITDPAPASLLGVPGPPVTITSDPAGLVKPTNTAGTVPPPFPT